MYVQGYLQGSENGRVVTIELLGKYPGNGGKAEKTKNW